MAAGNSLQPTWRRQEEVKKEGELLMGRMFLSYLKENNSNKKTIQQTPLCFVAKKIRTNY